MNLLKLFAVIMAFSSTAYAHEHGHDHDADHAEERVQHYEGIKVKNEDEAISLLHKEIAAIKKIVNKGTLSGQDLEAIHEISYSLENAVDEIRKDGHHNEHKVDNLDEAVQAIHSYSENHKEAETKEWFAKLVEAAKL